MSFNKQPFKHVVSGTELSESQRCPIPVFIIVSNLRTTGLDIKLVDAVARGASRFENLLAPLKTYWPPKKLTGPFLGYINAS